MNSKWWAFFTKPFKWWDHRYIRIMFWRAIFIEVFFEAPKPIWRALKTSILSTDCDRYSVASILKYNDTCRPPAPASSVSNIVSPSPVPCPVSHILYLCIAYPHNPNPAIYLLYPVLTSNWRGKGSALLWLTDKTVSGCKVNWSVILYEKLWEINWHQMDICTQEDLDACYKKQN